MGLYSYLTDKVTLGNRLKELPQYQEDVMRYVSLVVPEDAAMWREIFAKPPGVKLLKECMFNNASGKKAAVIMMITAGGTRTENFGPANPTGEYATLYLVAMVALNKLLGVEENVVV